ncbi:MAG: hypothetical protein H7Z38_19630 [Rubrivivax sp.]|nr:hypothetical protein [Pyrinomonadaceae bacterium]
MTNSNLLRLFLKLIVLSVLVSCLAFFTNKETHSRLAAAAPQALTLRIESQPQSPLQFSSTNILSSDPFSPKIEFTVTNTGAKGIRAFTVSREVVTDAGSRRAAILTNLTTQRKVLQPGQSKSDTVNEPYSPVPISSIILSIDFVEFVNGETWGKDAYKSGERLAGQRAGGRAAYEHFRQLLTRKGSSALLKAITSEGDELVPPQQNSPEWQDGFKTGVGLVRLRFNRAKKEGGLRGVELELQQPYDTSERRPE